MKSDHIKRMITLTGDNIKRLSLYFKKSASTYITYYTQKKFDHDVSLPIKTTGLNVVNAGMTKNLNYFCLCS
jgi:hypothetical protein